MNIFRCNQQIQNGQRCVFMKVEINEETGEIEDCGCIKREKENYNI